MKKYIFSALAIAAMMASCNNASPKMDEKPQAEGNENVSGILGLALLQAVIMATKANAPK